ncbi:MAG: HTTM domain-containing protein [Actinomycetota bacterium]|nr:HTTM domain-containing protein [Actinomycetota bacterium]
MRELLWTLSDRLHDTRDEVEGWVLDTKNGLHGAAACRIGIGLAVFLLLAGNFSTRQLWVGPAAIWAEPVRAVSNFPELGLLKGASSEIVTFIYLLVMLSALALMAGWHSRVAVVITLIGHIAIVGQNPTVGTQGDNLIRLTLLWFLLIDGSQHWSLDNRRRIDRAGADNKAHVSALKHAWNNSQETLPPWLSHGLHNIALAALAAQTVILYMGAGLSKVADSAWRHGNALYYTMQLPDYRPFPWLSDLLSHSQILLALITYAVLVVQLFFGPLLLNKTTRGLVLTLAVLINVFFALVMALPVSSLAFIAVTGLFVSAKTYEAIEAFLSDLFAPLGFWLADRWSDVLDRFDDARAGVRKRVFSKAPSKAQDDD